MHGKTIAVRDGKRNYSVTVASRWLQVVEAIANWVT